MENIKEKCNGCKRAESVKGEYVYTCNCNVKESVSVECNNCKTTDMITLDGRQCIRCGTTQPKESKSVEEFSIHDNELEEIAEELWSNVRSVIPDSDSEYMFTQGVIHGIPYFIEAKLQDAIKEYATQQSKQVSDVDVSNYIKYVKEAENGNYHAYLKFNDWKQLTKKD